MFREIEQRIGHRVINIYKFGSRVYGTHNSESDYDFITIVNEPIETDIMSYDFNIHVYGIEKFQQYVNEHRIHALESIFLPNNQKFEQHTFDFTLDLRKLRSEISSKSSNSWVKCKKKLEVEQNSQYIGLKSLFHSLRIVMFGIQIAKFGSIVDYSEANHIWEEIISSGHTDWEYFKVKYQPVYNNMLTEFRKLAPK